MCGHQVRLNDYLSGSCCPVVLVFLVVSLELFIGVRVFRSRDYLSGRPF